jgi:hypothetical protein
MKTNFQQKIEGHKRAVFRLKKLSVHALPGLCTLNIFEYEISLSCGKFRNHHREPLLGHGPRPKLQGFLSMHIQLYRASSPSTTNYKVHLPPNPDRVSSASKP